MMSDFTRRPLRGLRLLVATAMLASFSFASPVTAVAVTDFVLDKPSTAVELVQGASAEATFTAGWSALETAEPTLTVTSSEPWLVGTPTSVDVTGAASQEITFTVDTSGLSVGSHEGTLTVGLEGSELTHPVSVTVLDPDTPEPDDVLPGIPAPTSPFLALVDPVTDKRDIYAFTLAEGQFLHVEVAQTTEATAVAALWAPGTTSVADTSTALSSAAVDQANRYTADLTAKPGQAGEYFLSVAALSGTSNYSVTWSISGPGFSLSSPSTTIDVVQGNVSSVQSFNVNWGELGSAPVTFTVDSDQTWLAASPTTGDATSNTSQQVTFAADATGLAIGSHEATLTVRVAGATPQDHRVTLNVADPDTLEPDDVLPGITAPTSPFEAAVHPVTDKRDIYRFNLTEGQFLHVNVAQTTEATAVAALWAPNIASVADVAGALSSADVSQQAGFTAEFTAKAGQAGEYYLSMAAQSGASTYTVDYSILDPTFSLAATETAVTVVKSKDAGPRSFAVDWGAMGSVPVSFTVESDQPWLVTSPAAGDASSNTSTTVSVDASTSALPAGAHDATVTIGILGAAPQTHRVRVNVVEQPTMSIAAYLGSVSVNKPVAYGAVVTLKGSLYFPGSTKLGGKPALLQRYDGSRWVTAAVVGASGTGDYTAAVRVWANTRLRWRFAGDSGFNETFSPQTTVYAYASITRPSIPSRVRPGRNYTFYGDLRPQHAQNSSAVRIQFQYYYKRRWRSDVTMPIKVYNTDSYRSRYRYADRYVRGVPVRWRVRAIHPGDGSHTTTYSSWEYYRVY